MKPGDRRLLRDWLEQGPEKPKRLQEKLEELGRHTPELAPLLRYLALEAEWEPVLRAAADRERWHRKLSWRLLSLVFAVGAAGMVAFVLWGEPGAFQAAAFFFLGCLAFYLAVQGLLMVRLNRMHRDLRRLRDQHRAALDDLRKKIS